MTDLAARLKLIAEHAPALREAGVCGRITIGDVSFELQAAIPEQVATQPTAEDKPTGALDSPSTYGYSDTSALPGFVRPSDLPRKADR